jgi:hypothetical protein
VIPKKKPTAVAKYQRIENRFAATWPKLDFTPVDLKFSEMKRIVIAIALLISLHASAQDYLVTLKNDTLPGEPRILTFEMLDKVEFREGKNKKIYTAIQVKAVSIAGKTYRPVRTVESYKMMQLVKPGFLSIFLGRRENSLDYEIQYLVKLDGAAIEVPNIGFKRIMKDFLRDCPIVAQRIEEGQLGRKNVEQIVDDYNICLDKAAQSVQNSSTAVKATTVASDDRLVALDGLKSVLEKLSFPNQKDAIDIVGDLYEKIKNKQPVPRYLIESLKGLLKDVPDAQAPLEKVLGLVKAE